jgi:E3 ubiquitin-protein ligase BRE1
VEYKDVKYVMSLEKVVARLRKNDSQNENSQEDGIDSDITSLQNKVTGLQESFDMISQELDDTAAQFFAEQEKNGVLLSKMSGKDDKNIGLIREKLQVMKTLSQKEAELDLVKQKVENMREQLKTLEEVQNVVAMRMGTKDDEISKQSEEIKLTYTQLDKRTRMYNDLLNSFNELKDKYEKLNPFFLEYKKRFEDIEAVHGAELVKCKKLATENEILNKKVKGENIMGTMEEDYKRMLTCQVCCTKHKDTCISRCGHAFCKDCVADMVRVRNRKCPACGLKFGENDTHELYL